jgi:hypothetical protein
MQGRDTATYQIFPNCVDVYFADNPPGTSTHDVTLNFRSVPEPVGVVWIAGAGLMLMRRPSSPTSGKKSAAPLRPTIKLH